MSKKSFKTPFDSLLEGNNKASNKEEDKEIRATLILRSSHYDKLKAISFWEKRMIKSVVEEALSLYLNDYEKKKGPLQLPK
ncbi:MAG: hypothetical protein K0Q51_157 [Rickettsiaceae bacterium]|jgi:hypothetical protein|nr:hypothetical protein [Rickettsiaceae bacterium]